MQNVHGRSDVNDDSWNCDDARLASASSALVLLVFVVVVAVLAVEGVSLSVVYEDVPMLNPCVTPSSGEELSDAGEEADDTSVDPRVGETDADLDEEANCFRRTRSEVVTAEV